MHPSIHQNTSFKRRREFINQHKILQPTLQLDVADAGYWLTLQNSYPLFIGTTLIIYKDLHSPYDRYGIMHLLYVHLTTAIIFITVDVSLVTFISVNRVDQLVFTETSSINRGVIVQYLPTLNNAMVERNK